MNRIRRRPSNHRPRRPTRTTRRPPRPQRMLQRPKAAPRSKFRWRWLLLILLIAPAFSYISWLDIKIREQFEGKRWALPARVYARPLELFAAMPLTPNMLHSELKAIGYKPTDQLSSPGTYKKRGSDYYVYTRKFQFWDAVEPSRRLKIRFRNNNVSSIQSIDSGKSYALTRLEPRLIGKIYPTHNEDRILVQLKDVPQNLINTLIATEDRQFFEHNGISFRGIMRAMLANVKAGRLAQGGSTITQQLIKNFYLTSERTLARKLNEAVMALLIEWHYSKEEILEAYLNEVYLGQDGDRAIHGFGMASWFYFDKPLEELKQSEVSLLVGLVKGASQFNPRRFKERALERRNIVIDMTHAQGKITLEQANLAKAEPLNVTKQIRDRVSPYPGFLSLVRHQLHQDYREEDLRSEGLQIFTTLDPIMQRQSEKAMTQGIRKLERENRKTRNLQGAMVVTNSENGEVMAMANGRDSKFAGFNRPLNAVRQIGSLAKVAIYLAALENDGRYSLNTMIDDSPYEWTDYRTGEVWKPRNYDRRSHGKVSLHKALANSYNLATVRLGMDLGLRKIKQTMQHMGLDKDFKIYPSTLLGSISMSPLEVAQMYQTLASGGFSVPLRSIRDVLDHRGQPLQRYAISVEPRFEPEHVFLLNYALQQAVQRGTGKKVFNTLKTNRVIAGKTGTSNDLRDSWFAGFDSQYSVVTWLGRDDNRPIYLSGGEGAMVVWGELIKMLDRQSPRPITPSRIHWRWVDYNSGRSSNKGRRGAVLMPFIKRTGRNRLAVSSLK
ncbi:penicillin-binding protein 1B [Candidatus Albibeggiatoa sp. nov. NOAA]|uniref:penicillin-binding protein 1B n=1 Tax=Candidatus Albibeggiatoa sp. nov. NOAA TaxID=3162724 RepID=UPI0032FCCADF|nr:penicillin-binding protein 1B [Thiotrichaceae bacterium]